MSILFFLADLCISLRYYRSLLGVVRKNQVELGFIMDDKRWDYILKFSGQYSYGWLTKKGLL